MAIRNFWIEVEIDGRKTKLNGGPVNKDGKMKVKLYQRDEGTIHEAVTITCENVDDQLLTQIVAKSPDGSSAASAVRTTR